jgi:hypothetical protein
MIYQASGRIEKNWVRFAERHIVPIFYSIRKLEHRSLSLRSSAALVSVELAQVRKHPSDGFSRSLRLL